MAKSNFDYSRFMDALEKKEDIFTGDSVATMPDENVPSNLGKDGSPSSVIDAENWKREELMRQKQLPENALAENAQETRPYLPGGEYNPAPQGALAATTNPSSVPAEVPSDSPLSSVQPDQTTLSRTGDPTLEEQDQAVQNSLDEKVDDFPEDSPQAEAEPTELPPITVAAEDDNEESYLDKMKSLAGMFKEGMTKVEKVKYNLLANSQKNDLQLRFFLSLMDEGGKKNGKGLLGNIGTAGLNALDSKQLIEKQNNENEKDRYAQESKLVYDALTLEGRDRSHHISARRWDNAAAIAADKIRAGEFELKESDGNWVLVNKNTKTAEVIKDKSGKPVKVGKSKGAMGSQMEVLNWLSEGTMGERQEKMELYQKQQQAAVKSTGKNGADPTKLTANQRTQRIQEVVDSGIDPLSGKRTISEEQAAQIVDGRQPGYVQPPPPPKQPTGTKLLGGEGVPPEVIAKAEEIRRMIMNKQVTEEQGRKEIGALLAPYEEAYAEKQREQR